MPQMSWILKQKSFTHNGHFVSKKIIRIKINFSGLKTELSAGNAALCELV